VGADTVVRTADGTLLCSPATALPALHAFQGVRNDLSASGLVVSERLDAGVARSLLGLPDVTRSSTFSTSSRALAEALCRLVGTALDAARPAPFRLPTAWERAQLCRSDVTCIFGLWASEDSDESPQARALFCVLDVEAPGPALDLAGVVAGRDASSRARLSGGLPTNEPQFGGWPVPWGRGWSSSAPYSPLRWSGDATRLTLEGCPGGRFADPSTQQCRCYDGESLRDDCATDSDGFCDCSPD
jgi:hypothetical protein